MTHNLANGSGENKAGMAWFRMYAEFATDPKVQMLSEVDQRRFVMLLCLRCCNGHVTLHDDEVAFQLRISSDEWSETKRCLQAKNLITDDNQPTAWDKRQYRSDSSKERVSRHRARKKQEAQRPCNVTVTPPDTETDTDTDREDRGKGGVGETPTTPRMARRSPAKAGPSPQDALQAFEAYNATALECGLPQAAKLTKDRQRKIIARLKDYGLDGWSRALANVRRSSFLTGANDRSWRADLGFLLQAESFGKVHDGVYGNGRHAQAEKSKNAAWQVSPGRKDDTDWLSTPEGQAWAEREFGGQHHA